MKYTTYLRERGTWAAVFMWLLFSIETFLLTVAGSGWLMLYTALSLIMAYLLITYTDYRHCKGYLEELQKLADGLEDKYLLPEMMKEGKRQEERLLYDILHVVGKNMYEHVLKYKYEEREYKEYIEMWIHEVKVPIAGVKMMIANHGEKMLVCLEEEIDQIDGYTDQALYYARSNDVEKDYFIKELTLKDIVEDVILQNKRKLLEMRAILKMDQLDGKIYSDGKWLAFIINQVVGNSIKYAGWEPLVLKIYETEQPSGRILHIEDNGVGIPAAEVDRVWEKGFTGSNGRRFQKSTGIGLYLCRKLCTRLGHKMELKSEEGKGCHVIIRFPVSEYSKLAK